MLWFKNFDLKTYCEFQNHGCFCSLLQHCEISKKVMLPLKYLLDEFWFRYLGGFVNPN